MSVIKEKLLVYKGLNPYLNTLKSIVEKGEELSGVQLMFAEKLLVSTAIKTQDREALPLPEIKQFNIIWDKYSARPPFEFQKEGVNWLLNKKYAILGDDMGLGKTLQAIIASIETGANRTLIVCPNSLKINWAKELQYFIPQNEITIIKKAYIKPTKFTIINYEKLAKYADELIKEKFDITIADESHYIKSGRGSRRGKYFLKITNKVSRIWLLTGTPIGNRPIDFFNLLKVCRHDLGRRKDEYAQRYCGNLMTNWGWDTKGSSNLKELYFRTQDIILRRLKKDVLDLPPKQRVPIYLEMSSSRMRAMQSYVNEKFQDIFNGMDDPDSEHYGKNIDKGEKFIELAANRMFCAVEKIKDGSVQELVESCLDANKRVIIFTNYTIVADEYKTIFGDDAIVLDGRVKIEERQRIIDNFQSNRGPSVMVCNFKVGSVGINLTSAEVEVINDLPWDPATLAQAEDRIFRIGQTKKVVIYFPIYVETIDEAMFHSIRAKINDIDIAIDGKEGVTQFQHASVINEVYEMLKKQKKL
jgi:SWI/SNF-related matrix-associated actin-dependent regulator 1 of chromatin subfamily A